MNNNTIFLTSIKTNDNVIQIMKDKRIKASKEVTKLNKGTKVVYKIGNLVVSIVLFGSRGAIKAESNTNLTSLMTYLHKY